jgi:hypothetical protein
LAVALAVAFWVRSNWYLDEFWVRLPANRGLGLVSANNCASVAIQRRDGAPATYIVGYSQLPLEHFHAPKARSFAGFSAARDGDLSFVNVPYWFLITVLAALTLAPWIRWQFSLRMLLIAMTLAAVGLSAIIWAVK